MLAVARRRKGSRPVAWVLVLALLCGLWAAGVVGAQAPKPHLDWRPHFAFANRYSKHRAGAISYGVIGPNCNYQAHRGGRTVPMASTFKVMLLATYLRKARNRPLHHRDKELLSPMIRRSDNVA